MIYARMLYVDMRVLLYTLRHYTTYTVIYHVYSVYHVYSNIRMSTYNMCADIINAHSAGHTTCINTHSAELQICMNTRTVIYARTRTKYIMASMDK